MTAKWSKKHWREYMREYYRRPDVKARQKEYRDRPDVKARKKEYSQRPDVKARKKEYRDRPDVKARKKEYSQIKNRTYLKNHKFLAKKLARTRHPPCPNCGGRMSITMKTSQKVDTKKVLKCPSCKLKTELLKYVLGEDEPPSVADTRRKYSTSGALA